MFEDEPAVIIVVFDENNNQIVSWNRKPPKDVPYFDHITFGLINKMKKVGVKDWKAGKGAYALLAIYQSLLGKVTLDQTMADSEVIAVV